MPNFPTHSYGTEQMAQWMVPAMLKRMQTKADRTNRTNAFITANEKAERKAQMEAAQRGVLKSPDQDRATSLKLISDQAAGKEKKEGELQDFEIGIKAHTYVSKTLDQV